MKADPCPAAPTDRTIRESAADVRPTGSVGAFLDATTPHATTNLARRFLPGDLQPGARPVGDPPTVPFGGQRGARDRTVCAVAVCRLRSADPEGHDDGRR